MSAPQPDPALMDQGKIHLELGIPDSSLLPLALATQCTNRLMSSPSSSAIGVLGYGSSRGDAFAISGVVNRLTMRQGHEFVPFEAADFVASAGNSHALTTTCRVLLRERPNNSSVLMSVPTYFNATTIFKDNGLALLGVHTLSDGQVDVTGMKRAALDAAHQGQPVAFIYCIPSYNNPDGISMSSETRQQLVQLAHELDLFLVCDDVYQWLPFTGNPPPPRPVICFEEKASPESCRVISLGSFSKILAPAFRSGWIHSRSSAFRKRLEMYGELHSGGGFSAFSNKIVSSIIQTPEFENHVQYLEKELGRRAKIMCDVIEKDGMCTFSRPTGGYFVWLKLPAPLTADLLLTSLDSVSFYEGRHFSTNGTDFSNYVRLSFARYGDNDIESACAVICAQIRKLKNELK